MFHGPEIVIGVVAIVAIVGFLLVRAQRERQQFELMKAGLERGVTQFPGALPVWLVSLRRGVLSLALGVGLVVVGIVAWALAAHVPPPPRPNEMVPGRNTAVGVMPGPTGTRGGGPSSRPREDDFSRLPPPPPPPPPPGEEGDEPGPDGRPVPGRAEGPGPMPGVGGWVGRREGPEGRVGHGPPDGPRGPRFAPSPEGERWQRAQAQEVIGQIAVACGIILTLLGVVRIVFAGFERRYLTTGGAPPGP